MTTMQAVIDLSPLIPVVNGLITAAAGVMTAATPFIAYYAVMWLRNEVFKSGRSIPA